MGPNCPCVENHSTGIGWLPVSWSPSSFSFCLTASLNLDLRLNCHLLIRVPVSHLAAGRFFHLVTIASSAPAGAARDLIVPDLNEAPQNLPPRYLVPSASDSPSSYHFYPLSLSIYLSLCLSLSHAHTYTHLHIYTHFRE